MEKPFLSLGRRLFSVVGLSVTLGIASALCLSCGSDNKNTCYSDNGGVTNCGQGSAVGGDKSQTAPSSHAPVTATTGAPSPLYTQSFTVHGPQGNALSCQETWVFVTFTATGPVVDHDSNSSDLTFQCNDSGLPGVSGGTVQGILAKAPSNSEPSESDCVSATNRDPINDLVFQEMNSGMWLCEDDGSIVVAMQLMTEPSEAAASGVVSFEATAWPVQS